MHLWYANSNTSPIELITKTPKSSKPPSQNFIRLGREICLKKFKTSHTNWFNISSDYIWHFQVRVLTELNAENEDYIKSMGYRVKGRGGREIGRGGTGQVNLTK